MDLLAQLSEFVLLGLNQMSSPDWGLALVDLPELKQFLSQVYDLPLV